MEAPGLRVAVKKSVPVTPLEQCLARAGDSVPTVVIMLFFASISPFSSSAHSRATTAHVLVGLLGYCLTVLVTHILSSLRAESASSAVHGPEPKTGRRPLLSPGRMTGSYL